MEGGRVKRLEECNIARLDPNICVTPIFVNISLIRIFENSRKEPMRRIAFQLLRLSVFSILLIKLTGCGLLNPTMPVKVPIDFSKTGSVTEAEFWIPEADALEVNIEFYYQGGSKGRDRLIEIVGDDRIPGITVSIKAKILKKLDTGGYELFRDKTYMSTNKDLGGFTNEYVDRSIDHTKISPGHYRLRVETIKPLPELAGTPVKLCIRYYRR
jgi:hypothetical protein